jgi:hypothetical protein
MNDPFFEKRPEALGWEEYVELVRREQLDKQTTIQ